MAGELAIASVTAVLKHLLENGLADRNVLSSLGSEAVVSALAPDRIAVGELERPQLNIFLYRITPFTRLSREEEPTRKVSPPGFPLAVDLHYLVSAYAAQDLQAELLLGFALRLLHENRTLERDSIKRALASQSAAADGRVVAPAFASLAASSLADEVERVAILPQFPSTEELARLWSALQAHYRPSTTYKVSAIFVDG